MLVSKGMKFLWASGCSALLGDLLCGIVLARAFIQCILMLVCKKLWLHGLTAALRKLFEGFPS